MELLLASWPDSQQVTLDIVGKEKWLGNHRDERKLQEQTVHFFMATLSEGVSRQKTKLVPFNLGPNMPASGLKLSPERCSGIFRSNCQQAKPVFSEQSHVQCSVGDLHPILPFWHWQLMVYFNFPILQSSPTASSQSVTIIKENPGNQSAVEDLGWLQWRGWHHDPTCEI